MKRTGQIALTIALLAFSACHKDNKEAQLKALDEAYQSGVFTKEEYDAKRAALIGPPPVAPAAPAAAVPAAPPPAEPPPVNPPAVAPPDTSVAPPVATAAQPVAAPPQTAPPPKVVRQTPTLTPAQPVPVAPPPQPQPQPVQTAPVTPPPPSPPPHAAAAEPEPAPLAGCQDAESRSGGPNGVQQRFFHASEDAVRSAALQALANLDFTIHKSSEHDIEASKKRHLSVVVGGGGEKVTLHFSGAKRNEQAGTWVTGETKKSITGRLAQKTWTSAVLAQISCNLRAR